MVQVLNKQAVQHAIRSVIIEAEHNIKYATSTEVWILESTRSGGIEKGKDSVGNEKRGGTEGGQGRSHNPNWASRYVPPRAERT